MNKREWTVYDGWPDKKKKDFGEYNTLTIQVPDGLLLIFGAIIFLPLGIQKGFVEYVFMVFLYSIIILVMTRKERKNAKKLFGM